MKILRAIAFLGMLALGMMFSLIAVGVLVVAGLGLWGYLTWKTRHIRRAMGEQTRETIIEGEVVQRESSVVLEGDYQVISDKPAEPSVSPR